MWQEMIKSTRVCTAQVWRSSPSSNICGLSVYCGVPSVFWGKYAKSATDKPLDWTHFPLLKASLYSVVLEAEEEAGLLFVGDYTSLHAIFIVILFFSQFERGSWPTSGYWLRDSVQCTILSLSLLFLFSFVVGSCV